MRALKPLVLFLLRVVPLSVRFMTLMIITCWQGLKYHRIIRKCLKKLVSEVSLDKIRGGYVESKFMMTPLRVPDLIASSADSEPRFFVKGPDGKTTIVGPESLPPVPGVASVDSTEISVETLRRMFSSGNTSFSVRGDWNTTRFVNSAQLDAQLPAWKVHGAEKQNSAHVGRLLQHFEGAPVKALLPKLGVHTTHFTESIARTDIGKRKAAKDGLTEDGWFSDIGFAFFTGKEANGSSLLYGADKYKKAQELLSAVIAEIKGVKPEPGKL